MQKRQLRPEAPKAQQEEEKPKVDVGSADDILKKLDTASRQAGEQERPRGRFICKCGNPNCQIGEFTIWYTGRG